MGATPGPRSSSARVAPAHIGGSNNPNHQVDATASGMPTKKWASLCQARLRSARGTHPSDARVTAAVPPQWEWVLVDGWWAQIDSATELRRYARLLGSLPVAR